MFAKIKLYLAAGLSIVTAILYALWQGEKATRAKELAEREEAANEYQKAGSEALVKGLEEEAKVKNEKPDSIVDHFS